MAHLEIAHLILILVSTDFVASDYAYNKEMDKCMQVCHKGTRVVPVIVSEAIWKSSPFGKLTPLMGMGDKPIKSCRGSIKDTIIPVGEKIHQIIEEIALELRYQDFPQNLSDSTLLSDIRSTEIELWTNPEDFSQLIRDINQMGRQMQFANSDEDLENLFQWLTNFPDHMNRLQIDIEAIEEFWCRFKQKKGDENAR